MNQKPEYFTRFPNEYIQGNIKTKYGVNRKFYITYILIDKYRSYEDYSFITIRKILNFYGYKTHRNKPKAFKEILDVLEYMIKTKMIEVSQELDTVGYDTCIEIKVISENFYNTSHFSKLTSSQLNTIMRTNSVVNRECLLMTFLYINSYISTRPRNKDGKEVMSNPETKPEAFWKSIKGMSEELAMSKDTIVQCIKYLTMSAENKNALLIKREAVKIQPDPNKPPINVPNIYVLNKEGYRQEIDWALYKIIENYGIDTFTTMKGGKIENKKT